MARFCDWIEECIDSMDERLNEAGVDEQHGLDIKALFMTVLWRYAESLAISKVFEENVQQDVSKEQFARWCNPMKNAGKIAEWQEAYWPKKYWDVGDDD